MQLLAKLEKNLYMLFRSTLNFRKFKVALNHMYKISLNFAKLTRRLTVQTQNKSNWMCFSEQYFLVAATNDEKKSDEQENG